MFEVSPFHFPFYSAAVIENGIFAKSNAKIPERGKFPWPDRSVYMPRRCEKRDRKTSDGPLKGKATDFPLLYGGN